VLSGSWPTNAAPLAAKLAATTAAAAKVAATTSTAAALEPETELAALAATTATAAQVAATTAPQRSFVFCQATSAINAANVATRILKNRPLANV